MREPRWQPRVIPPGPPPRTAISHQEICALLQGQIDALTEEINQWMSEFGEPQLLTLYENRARLAELLATSLHIERP